LERFKGETFKRNNFRLSGLLQEIDSIKQGEKIVTSFISIWRSFGWKSNLSNSCAFLRSTREW